jgi:hypothetical protein
LPDFAAVARGVSDALALTGVEAPPLLLTANAPPVIANTNANEAITVAGLTRIYFRIAENIGYLSCRELKGTSAPRLLEQQRATGARVTKAVGSLLLL